MPFGQNAMIRGAKAEARNEKEFVKVWKVQICRITAECGGGGNRFWTTFWKLRQLYIPSFP